MATLSAAGYCGLLGIAMKEDRVTVPEVVASYLALGGVLGWFAARDRRRGLQHGARAGGDRFAGGGRRGDGDTGGGR